MVGAETRAASPACFESRKETCPRRSEPPSRARSGRPPERRGRMWPCADAVSARFQGVHEIRSRSLPGRNQAEEETTRQRRKKTELHHTPIQLHAQLKRRIVGNVERLQQPNSAICEDQPRAAPNIATMRLSVISWRTTRLRPAPIDSRIAISRLRARPRASSRFATFEHAIIRISATSPISILTSASNCGVC